MTIHFMQAQFHNTQRTAHHTECWWCSGAVSACFANPVQPRPNPFQAGHSHPVQPRLYGRGGVSRSWSNITVSCFPASNSPIS